MKNKYTFLSVFVLLVFPFIILQAQTDSISPADTTINLSNSGSFLQLNQKQLQNLPFLNLSTYGLVSPSAYRLKGDQMFYYGIETTGDHVFIDDMQISDASDFPVRLIQTYNLYTTQAPINMGFTTGGITSIKTISNLNDFTFLMDAGTDLAYNMQGIHGEFFLSVPLISKKRRKNNKHIPTLLVAGKYRWSNNNDPVWKKTQKLKKDVLDALIANPLRDTGQEYGTFMNAVFVTTNDFTTQKVPDYNGSKGLFPFIKFELPVTDNALLTFGNYSAIQQKNVSDFDNSIFNARGNPLKTQRNFDTYLKWNQQIEVKENFTISYNLMVQYTNHYFKTEDRQLKNNFFEYGYIGSFTTLKEPVYWFGDYVSDSVNYNNVWILKSPDRDTLVQFNPLGQYPGLSNYTSNYYDIFAGNPVGHYDNMDQILLGGGLINGSRPDDIYGLWNNTATNSGYYGENSFEKIRSAIQVNINYHAQHLTVGGEYNRETQRHYSIEPDELWNLMRSLTNFHFNGLDASNPIPIEHNGQVDTLFFYRKYVASYQQNFDKNLRKALGLPVDGLDFILTDSYNKIANTISYYDKDGIMHTIKTPDNLWKLNLFSATELLNGGYGYIDYSGYDYTGSRQQGKVDPYAFYKNNSIAAEQPEYWSAFLNDEFKWKNLHVRLGLRLDVYNANHPVMNDSYSLFPITNVAEAMEQNTIEFKKPASIGDDYLVYVDNTYYPNRVTGFRKGDRWFNADGEEIEDLALIDAGDGISPWLKYPEVSRVGGEGWKPNMTFDSYNTVYNILPQIAIDYSIKKRLNIYVNYSSFSQNPRYYSGFKPEEFYYWQAYSNHKIISNSDLQPMVTGKLFAGVKAVVWRNLVVNGSYFMTSIKNYIEPKLILGAYPNDYLTLVNAKKLTTTNGFSAKVDFVNPRISGPFGGMNVTVLFPDKDDPNYFQISDEVFNSYLGYRFANGNLSGFAKALNGFSAGIYYQYRRGTPYYYYNNNNVKDIEHTPAVNLFNLNIQKDFRIGKKATMSLYLTVENLFNIKNSFKVYAKTGKADDDGFLSDPENNAQINNHLNPDTYRLLYQMHLYNPAFYDIPSIWRMGLIFKW